MIKAKEHKEHTNEPEMGLNFETVWAMFQETRKLIEENAKGFAEVKAQSAESREKFDKDIAETERLIKENAKGLAETKAQFAEVGKYLDKVGKRIDNLGKQLGEVNHRFGDVIEHLVISDVVNKFNKLGYTFNENAAEPNREFEDEDGNLLAEADIYLENGDCMMIIEVKAKPNEADVKAHINRLRRIRAHVDKEGETRKLLGAIAGAVMSKNVRELALKNGLYVLEQSGETMKLLAPQGQPRMWLPASE